MHIQEKLNLRSSKGVHVRGQEVTLKVKAHQKSKTGNSENGNKEWNANMAVKLL